MKSLFAKHFIANAVIIVLSFVVLGCSFLYQVNRFAVAEKHSVLQTTLEQAIDSTVSYIELRKDMEGVMDSNAVTRLFNMYTTGMSQMAEDSDSTMFVCQEDGALLLIANKNGCYNQETGVIPNSIVTGFEEDGTYYGVSTMGGYLGSSSFVVGAKAQVKDQGTLLIFATLPATATLDLFSRLSRYFVMMTVLVLILTLIVTLIVVRQTVKPMRQIALASRSFAKGDYSARVPIPKYKYGGELYELAAAFNNMADAFENAEMTRRGLVANVAHDLRTPMTTIAGFVDGILDGTIKPDKQEYYLKIVSDEVKRLSRMASSILEMSRFESGEKALNLALYDITETLRLIIISFEQKISQKNIELEIDIPDRINIVADHDAMFQAIYNLMDNALKFVPDNGKIIIYMSEHNSELQFNIINTGSEISKEDIKYIFDRFYKGDRSRTGSASGSGLGLYIVKTVINRHGGDVFAKSENNSTEFCFRIPIKAEVTQENRQ